MTLLTTLIGTLLFAVAGPVVGCLLAGLDRIISARMQGRVGPPLLQPYYDVRKLLAKEQASVNAVDEAYITCAIIFCLILIFGLNWETWVRFAVWFALGLVVYFTYSRKHSQLNEPGLF